MKVNFEKREDRVDGWDYKSKDQLVKKQALALNTLQVPPNK